MKMGWKKLTLFILLILILSAGLIYHSLISYGLDQLRGQLRIIYQAEEVDEIISDPETPDSLRQRLLFVEKVKQFAIDSLGLKASKNYTTIYDQHSKPVLLVLTASAPFELKAYKWKFPILGEVPYKGFFEFEKGYKEEKELISNKLDTDLGEVSAWSTLGWFRDPILSGMLKRSDGELAELIIHEMLHATVYIKNKADFNENLASFVGEQGAVRFLSGLADSSKLAEYLFRKNDYDLFSHYMLKASVKADSIYKNFKNKPETEKIKIKKLLMDEIVDSLKIIPFHKPQRFSGLFIKREMNNAYLMNFIRYDSKKDEMEKELRDIFKNNLRAFIKHYSP
jgi:predicted aminopeptidase